LPASCLAERALVEGQQFSPGAFGTGLVVDLAAGDGPAVIASLIDLDGGRAMSGGEGGFELVLRGRIALVVVGGDGAKHFGLYLGDQQVRAIGLIGHQASAMKGSGCAHTPGQRGGGAEGERSTHAVALHTQLVLLVGLRLGIEEGEVVVRVAGTGVGSECGGQRHDLGAILGLVEVEASINDRGFGAAVEGIGDQHHVASSGESLPEGAEDGAQAENVGPDQHAGPGAFTFGIEERRVGNALGHGDVDVGGDDARLGGQVGGGEGCGSSSEREGSARNRGVVGESLVNEVITHEIGASWVE